MEANQGQEMKRHSFGGATTKMEGTGTAGRSSLYFAAKAFLIKTKIQSRDQDYLSYNPEGNSQIG